MARLDAKQRAIYRMQGVPMKEEDDTRITNILGDNCTITLDADDGELPSAEKPQQQPPPESTPQPKPEQPQPPVQPPPAQKPNGTPTWLKWALAAAIGASAAGPAVTAYVMRPAEEQAGGSIFRFDTELPPWMEQNDAP